MLMITPCKEIQDSLGFWTPGTGFWILCQWNLDSGFLDLYSGFHSHGFRIPEAKLLYPIFHELNFLDSGIRIPLHGATCLVRGYIV